MTVNHVAIILDGNRRYAKKHHLPLLKGHEKGAEVAKNLLKWSSELGIKEVTLHTFSTQNFNRAQEEVGYLFKLAEGFFGNLIKASIEKNEELFNSMKFTFIGRLTLFPKKIQDLANDLMEKTKNNPGLKVNIAFGYGGREEITDAVNKIIKKGIKQVDENIISDNLYLKSEPDLIIRTSGEHRTSGFLPWQGAYSEWFFLKKTWPEFNKTDLQRILAEFASRERRFGV